MRQCLLRRGDRLQVAWIPSQFAIHSKFLRLGGENGWMVVRVYSYLPKVELPHGYLSGGVFHK